MKNEQVSAAVLRQFLLGKLDDEERQQIESLFISDSSSRERILAVEQDLIEDYLDDGLESADKASFLLQYAETLEQRRKLRISKSLKKYALAEAATNTKPVPQPIGRQWLPVFRPAYLVPIAASLVIFVLVVVVWLNGRTEQLNLTIERELASLNAPASMRESLPQMSSLVLPPVALRSLERQTEFTSRVDIRFVEFRLLWIQKDDYKSYSAVIRKVGSNDQYNIRDLQLENSDGRTIRVRLPVEILTRGVYQIDLSGIGNGTSASPEEYSFTVTG